MFQAMPGFGFGDGNFHMSFGIGAFPFAFFTSSLNIGEPRPPVSPRGTPQFEEEQFLSKVMNKLPGVVVDLKGNVQVTRRSS